MKDTRILLLMPMVKLDSEAKQQNTGLFLKIIFLM
jgi:hypothetical protein